MSRRLLMGLDVGGGTGRCLLVDADTAAVTHATRPLHHPPATETFGIGFDLATDEVFRLIGEAAREALARAGAGPRDVVAVATTGMRHSNVVLDRDDRVLLSVPTRDARAFGQSSTLAADRGETFYRKTGHWPSPIAAAARLRYLADTVPDGFARMRALLGASDWLAWRLCGELAVEASIASETLLCAVGERRWDLELADAIGVARAALPPVVSAGTALGALRDDAARHLGLAAGIPVVAGGGDTQCGLVGAGAVRASDLGVVAGTTMPVQLVVSTPVVDPGMRLWTSHHAVPGLWVLESNGGQTGDMLDWLASILYAGERNGAGRLCGEAAESIPGAHGLLSTLGTEVWNARELGFPLGHLTMSHLLCGRDPRRRRHVARAVLEGMAFALRANADQVREVSGIQPIALHVGGGMTRSELFSTLASDVLGVPALVSASPQSSALGAAICAGVGAGVFRDIAEGAERLARPRRRVEPDAERRAVYDDVYDRWAELRTARADADALAASQAAQAMLGAAMAEPPRPRAEAGFRPRILVTASMDEASLDALRELGDVRYASFREELNLLVGDDLADALRGQQVFVTEVDCVDADVLAKAPDVRVIVSCRGNPVNIDLPACTAHGVPVVSTPGRNADAVADLTVTFLLMLARKLPEADRFLRDPAVEAGDTGRMGMAFERLQGRELGGKTVGLVGLGAVGRKVAARLAPFGVRVLAADPYLSSDAAAAAGAEAVSLDELLRESDAVSLHAAVEGGPPLLGASEIASMKEGAWLINTARAALVDEAALLDALRSGRLGGAAVDVFAVEPPGADHPLLALPNVIATPHVGGNTVEVASHQGRIVAADLRELLAGERPGNVLNPETLARFSWTEPRTAPTEETLARLAAGPAPSVTDLEAHRKAPATTPARPIAKVPARPGAAQPTAVAALASAHPATSSGGAASSAPEQAGETPRLFGKLRGLVKRASDGARALAGRGATNGKASNGASAPIATPAAAAAPAASPGHARAAMHALLEDFLRRLGEDAAVREYATGKSFAVLHQMTDLDLGFYMIFRDGFRAGVGDSPEPPAVTLKMTAEVLDKLFTARVSGPRMAMSGKLSFTGDTLLAMSMRRIQKSLERCYAEARAASGMTDAILAGSGAPAPAAAAPAPVADGDEREVLVKTLEELLAAGVITSTGGNVSVRVAGEAERVWITPNQLHKGRLSPDMLVKVDLDGNPVAPGPRAPSSERLIHCSILRQNPQAGAVIHSHAPKATTLALTELPFLPISTEAAFIGEIPRVPFMMPGTPDLATAVARAIGSGPAVLMQNHGLVVAGADLHHAAMLTLVIEQTADKLLACHALGKAPPVLPDELVRSLRELGEMLA